ncbi:Protein arginine N-methyltransferase 7 [Acorus gramineus]|uniref:Protein arginine N-methyltransferase 7 n=1 Tax=Acorus gramineus TaxID=55184 RepID=A0AAV9ACN1_ACOGR|nr:Protein arginine N-methyltransferase 7 [Acorus gramineus]
MATREVAFQQTLDPLTGVSEWIVVDDGDSGVPEVENPKKSFLSSTSYLDMLNDSFRNRAFHEAIKKTIKCPSHVLDIGAGTGLLSMMAARAMDSIGPGEGTVSACESYLPMVKMMRRVLRVNGLDGRVRVFLGRSDELEEGRDLQLRADVLVSEILDSELLGEGLIPTLQHAHDKLLVENPQTVPHRATVYGQLVESTSLWKMHDLHSSEEEASDGVHLTTPGFEKIIGVKQQQHPMHCDALKDMIKPLSDPFKVFEFDFWKRPESHGETELQIKAYRNGRVHAIISWWVLQLDDEGTIFYSTAPQWISDYNNQGELTSVFGAKDWCDHWKPCIWFTPGAGLHVNEDEMVQFQATHNDISISYNFNKVNPNSQPESFCTEGQLMLSPEKIANYGDKHWRFSMLTAAKNALQGKSSPLCVIVDDSVFLTIVSASLSQTSNVMSTLPGLQGNGAKFLHSVADTNGFSMDRVKVLGRRVTCLTMDDMHRRKVDILFAEPFYRGYEGMLPWQNLRFWKERTLLDSILSEDVTIMPCKGILKASAMSFPDLWRSRRFLKSVEGFDHSAVSEILGACGDLPPSLESPCLPYFIWQCGEIKELSKVFSVMEFDFSKPIHACSGKTNIRFSKPGVCHGFALWIDWVMDEKNSIVISTGPDSKYWKQGVKLLSQPVPVNADGSCSPGESGSSELEASFDPFTAELKITSSFS